MLSLRDVIPWDEPITQLSRWNHSIRGVNRTNQVVNLDYKHGVLEFEPDPIKDVKGFRFLKNQLGSNYFFITSKQISTEHNKIILDSNQKADFDGPLDSNFTTLCFTKFHHLHQKHSINLMPFNEQKKIVKLTDSSITNIHISKKNEIIYQTGNGIHLISGEHYEKEQTIIKNCKLFHDQMYVYGLGKKYIKMFKQKSMKSILEIPLLSNDPINKIQNFKFDILVSQSRSLSIFDMRKLVHPYIQESIEANKQFYYEPNLQKLFISARKGLHIYNFR